MRKNQCSKWTHAKDQGSEILVIFGYRETDKCLERK